METMGVRDPEARIKQVSRSLSLVGTEWHRMTRSKSPARKRWAASFTEDADSTKYPAECKTMFRVSSNDASGPTERTRVSGMRPPNSVCVKMAGLAPPLRRRWRIGQTGNIGGRSPSSGAGPERDYCFHAALLA